VIEIEAKFSVPNNAMFSKYVECDRIGEFYLGQATTDHVVDNYLDTIDDDIWNAGYKMRVRNTGEHSYITIKSASSAHHRFSVRREIEFELHSDPNDILQWTNKEAIILVFPIIAGKPLNVKVELKQCRNVLDLFYDGYCIGLLSLDEVVVCYSGKKLDEFHVLEVELCNSNKLSALDSISNQLVSDGLVMQNVAKVGRAIEVVEKFRQGTSKYVA
jgi:inorganic triphosphatase YgiF